MTDHRDGELKVIEQMGDNFARLLTEDNEVLIYYIYYDIQVYDIFRYCLPGFLSNNKDKKENRNQLTPQT